SVAMCARSHAGSISRYPGRDGSGLAANSPKSILIRTGGSTASPWRKYGVSPGQDRADAPGEAPIARVPRRLEERVAVVGDADLPADGAGDHELVRPDELVGQDRRDPHPNAVELEHGAGAEAAEPGAALAEDSLPLG